MNSDLLIRFATFAIAEGGSIPDAMDLVRAVNASSPVAGRRVRLVLKNASGDFEFRVRDKMLAHGFTQEEVSQVFVEASLD